MELVTSKQTKLPTRNEMRNNIFIFISIVVDSCWNYFSKFITTSAAKSCPDLIVQ